MICLGIINACESGFYMYKCYVIHTASGQPHHSESQCDYKSLKLKYTYSTCVRLLNPKNH